MIQIKLRKWIKILNFDLKRCLCKKDAKKSDVYGRPMWVIFAILLRGREVRSVVYPYPCHILFFYLWINLKKSRVQDLFCVLSLVEARTHSTSNLTQ